jgi:hypothetical protein
MARGEPRYRSAGFLKHSKHLEPPSIICEYVSWARFVDKMLEKTSSKVLRWSLARFKRLIFGRLATLEAVICIENREHKLLDFA